MEGEGDVFKGYFEVQNFASNGIWTQVPSDPFFFIVATPPSLQA